MILRRFVHQREHVADGILNERHARIEIVQPGDAMWRAGEYYAPLSRSLDRQRDVRAGATDARAVIDGGRVMRFLQQRTDTGSVDELKVTEAVRFSKPARVLVKCLRAVQVADRACDLSNAVQVDMHGA